ncbi:hypothetical protein NYQ31_09300 [Curtobacterium flaccumfaciens]|jgi:hypothetical protein|uniref:hypothetical protein n=1 Tax=Curtobacterium TaxID=2034 RepID=UPI0011B7A634|nr:MULTISPECIES: hypothetical protein [Curtobacterium]MCS6558594.1 hypothetical protein [Curtobacterium flaccumfaciens]
MSDATERPLGESVKRLARGISELGLPVGDTLEDLADLITLYARPQSVGAIAAQIRLEWLGGRDRPLVDSDRLSHGDLLTVIARSAVFDATDTRDSAGVAAMTGWSQDHVRNLTSTKQLWGYDIGHGSRYPTWQFSQSGPDWKIRPIPGMRQITQAIPDDAPPLLVRKVMTTEHPTLIAKRGTCMSPADWLTTGRPPWPVVQILFLYFRGATDLMEGILLQYESGRAIASEE